jgi:DNA transformation protein
MVTKDDSFKEYVEHELLREIHGISIRRMFNGHGIYLHGMFIGLINNGVLYFKVDSGNKKAYEEEGSKPFVYRGHTGKSVELSFWEVPPVVMDNPTGIASWVTGAYEAALRSKKSRKAESASA